MNHLQGPAFVADEFQREEDENQDPLAPKPWEIHRNPYVILHVKPEVLIGVTVLNKVNHLSSKPSSPSITTSHTDNSRSGKRFNAKSELMRENRDNKAVETDICMHPCSVVLERIHIPIITTGQRGELLVSNWTRPSSPCHNPPNKRANGKAKLVATVRQRKRRAMTNDFSSSQLSGQDALQSVSHRQCKVLLERLNVRSTSVDLNSNNLPRELELTNESPSNDNKKHSKLRSGKQSSLKNINSTSKGTMSDICRKQMKLSRPDSCESLNLNHSLRVRLKRLNSDLKPGSSPSTENLINIDETVKSSVDANASCAYPMRQKSNNSLKKSTRRSMKSNLDDVCSKMKQCYVLLERIDIPVEDWSENRISQSEMRKIITRTEAKSLKWVKELKKRNADISSVGISNQSPVESVKSSPSKNTIAVRSSPRCRPFPSIFIKTSKAVKSGKAVSGKA